MTIYDGFKRLLDDCDIPHYKRGDINLENNSKLMYNDSLLFYFTFEER